MESIKNDNFIKKQLYKKLKKEFLTGIKKY